MKFKRGVIPIAIIGALLVSLFAPMAVSANGSPVLPTSFYGDVTVNDTAAPEYTVITGRIVDAVGSPGEGTITITEEGKYGVSGLGSKLSVKTDSLDDVDKEIEFYVKLPDWTEAQKADPDPTAIYDSDTHQVNLNVTVRTITASAGEEGSIDPSGEFVIGYGADQAFAITPDVGYEIEDVLVDGDSKGAVESYLFENVVADHTIHATFTQITHTLTMAVVGEGTVTPESGAYAEGDMAISATPASGWEFAGWSTTDMAEIAELTLASTTLTLDKDKTVTATFTEIGVLAVTTTSAAGIGTTTATLNGNLADLGDAPSVEVSFEWGTTDAYGNTATVTASPLNAPSVFSANLSGLSVSTTYHFRAVAVGDGTSNGGDMTFTTATPPAGGGGGPAPTTLPAGTTDVRGDVNPAGVFLEPVTATSDDELCTLTIPEGTVGLTEELEPIDEITMVIMDEPPLPPKDAHVVGLTYDFGPDRATFEPSITLTFSYDPDDLPEGVAEKDLVLAYYDEDIGGWVELDCVVDTLNKTITASIAHFTTFAVIGKVPALPPAPAAFTVSSLVVSPSELAPGEEVNISVLVANTGGESGSYSVVLKINGVKEAEEMVTVVAGSSQEVSFTVSKEATGIYSVAVAQLSGSFTVVTVLPEPVAFSVSRLSIQPAEVEAATVATVAVLVTNTGGESGSYTVVLKIDGVKEDEKSVTIAAGESQEVSFSVSREEAGDYTVAVDGLSGSFTVLLLVEPPGFNWLLVGEIIAGVIVVGLLIYFLVFRRRAY